MLDGDTVMLSSVHSLHLFVFSVPNLVIAESFYKAFGLDVKRVGSTLELYTEGHKHCWGRIHEAPGKKKLLYVSFGCYPEDLELLEKQVNTFGVPVVASHPFGSNEGFWITHPDGFAVQVVAAEKSSPDAHTISRNFGSGGGYRKSPCWSSISKVKPRRLSHALIFSSDIDQGIRFYEALGLCLSDRSADVIAFMHSPHGSDHHLVALAKSNGPGLHHTSWDVGSIDEVGAGMRQMSEAGFDQGWGVGRHILGSNYFYYVRDPWGSYCEYSFDIDYIPKGTSWIARDHAPDDSFYLWGPGVPAEFVRNHEVDGDQL
jgi:catechol 2,3-dioxygenase-like lactoylglutathione lyase family enzyme